MKRHRLPANILLTSLFVIISTYICGQNEDLTRLPALPEIPFKKKSVYLTETARKTLDSVAVIINQDKSYKIKVISFDASCEACMQYSWDRAFSVTEYLRQKKVDSTRIIFMYGQEGSTLIVKLLSTPTTDEGPSWVPAPIPCLSYHKLTRRRCKDPHR